MSPSDRSTEVDIPEWAGRLLVVLQFGLLALLGWRAMAAPSAIAVQVASLLAVSAMLALWALQANRPGNFNIRPTPRDGGMLITSGPYRWIRHPMYTSVLLAAAAAAWKAFNIADALLWSMLLVVLLVKSTLEERALTQRFPGYRDYRTRTTRFIPWLI